MRGAACPPVNSLSPHSLHMDAQGLRPTSLNPLPAPLFSRRVRAAAHRAESALRQQAAKARLRQEGKADRAERRRSQLGPEAEARLAASLAAEPAGAGGDAGGAGGAPAPPLAAAEAAAAVRPPAGLPLLQVPSSAGAAPWQPWEGGAGPVPDSPAAAAAWLAGSHALAAEEEAAAAEAARREGAGTALAAAGALEGGGAATAAPLVAAVLETAVVQGVLSQYRAVSRACVR